MKFLLRRWRLLTLLALLSCSPPLAAQVALKEIPLKVQKIEIRHIGPPAVSDDLIRANIRVKVGDVIYKVGNSYDVKNTNVDVQTLKATGYFANIRVAVEEIEDGVKLIYVVSGKLVLTDIRLEGNQKFSNSKILKKVTSKIGEPLDEYKLFRDAQEIQKMYEKSGYQKTRVVRKITPNESLGRGTVTFEIAESPKVRIVDVQFVNAEAFSQKKLRRTIKTRRWWMFSWLTGSGRLKEDQFDEDKEKLKEFYREEGYIDFDIRDIQYQEETPTRMILKIFVFEGKQYKVGSVQLKGNNKYTPDQIRRGLWVLGKHVRLRMTEGETFTPKGLEKDLEAIQDFYGAHGYIGKGDADRIRVIAIKNANVERGTMDLEYQLEEGERSFVEKIEIKGNTKTKDKVIRREMAVAPGEVFNMVRVKLSKERLNGLQYFSKVDTEVEPTDVPNRKNLIVGVEEGQSGNFYVGAGFSSIDQLFGYVGLTQSNFDLFNPPYFTGGGQRLRLQATLGTEQQNFDILFVEPWFLNRKLALDVNLFHRDIGYYSDLYNQVETGVSVGLERALFIDALRAGISYTIENIDLQFDPSLTTTNIFIAEGPLRGRSATVIPPQISPELQAEEGERLVSKVGLTLAYDTRRGGLLPNGGQRTQISGELAGGPFGGDTDFYKLELESNWYFRGPREGHVLEIGGKIGVAAPYGDTATVPLFDRFFLGGANTVRGYKYRYVGPKDVLGEPIGGGTYWFGFAEYSIPIVERLRFAVFYDVGMVYQDEYSFDPKNFRTGLFNDNVGVGLRINIPQMGPLRLDYGFPINHGPDTSGSGRFQFSVGYSRPL